MMNAVIYHDDNDGFVSALVAYQALGPDTELYPFRYGQQPPLIPYYDILVVDVVLPREDILELANYAGTLVVLDHHQSSLPNTDLEYVTVDTTKAACMLTWELFHKDEPAPWYVAYTQDYDLWRFTLPHSREVNAALQSYPRDLSTWLPLIHRDLDSIIVEGHAILRYQQTLIDKILESSRRGYIDEYECIMVNSPVLLSELGNALLDASDEEVAAVWYQNSQGEVNYSLRSRPHSKVDVAKIAEHYGGGGHPHAAGFRYKNQ
jgi:oligoribonuclease NrnB/cAMP/cGMP phosphodiesterase (DHH superfamily)